MTFAPEQLKDLLRIGFFGRVVADGDVCAFASVGDGGGTAHPGVTPGDERLSTGKPA